MRRRDSRTLWPTSVCVAFNQASTYGICRVFDLLIHVALYSAAGRVHLCRAYEEVKMKSLPNRPTVTVNQLQLLVEQDKMALSREIHDELGGHLIATAMDLASLKQRFADTDADAVEKIDRAMLSLNAAVDMMRRVTEELHPTLLDNVGLFAALRWQIKHMSLRSNITCTEHLPELELRLRPATAITLFRVGQEAMAVAENQAGVTLVDFAMMIEDESITMRVHANGVSTPPKPETRGYVALEFLRHRVDAMNGTVTLGESPAGGLSVLAQIHLDMKSVSDTQAVRVLEMGAASAATGLNTVDRKQ
jgi:signal transduction histidine kinase